MKTTYRFVLLAIITAVAACSQPTMPSGPGAVPRLNGAPTPPQDQTQTPTASDSTAARGGGNLMGGN